MDKKSRDLVMGKLFMKNKDYKMAEKSFLDYLNSCPEDYQALKMLAQVYEQLNDYSKAFDIYERCYLTQPERKGVILDICRLLLMNDSLDHVDPRKWSILATQAFPSNPIVKSLRESIPSSNGLDQAPIRPPDNDLVVSKLDKLEERLITIENLLKNLCMNQKAAEPAKVEAAKPVINFASPAPALKAVDFSFAPKPSEPKLETPPKPSTTPSPGLFKLSEPSKPELSLPGFKLPDQKSDATNSSGFKLSDAKVDSNFGGFKPPESKSDAVAANLFSTSLQNLKLDAKPEPKPELSFGSPSTPFKLPDGKSATKVGGSLFGFGAQPLKFESSSTDSFSAQTGEQNPTNSANPFAEGLKKFGLPLEGQWMNQKKDEEPKRGDTGGDDDNEDADDGENEVVDNPELPIENTCDLKPVEIRTGEEDEDVVFEHRCKLFRFRDKEYKERGLGNIKVLKHKSTGAGRLIMRREQINLVCLNCWSCSKIERVRDTQVRFGGIDASDGDAEMTVFLAKFKTPELTDKFISEITKLFPNE